MGPVVGQILPYALGLALTPTAIIAVILMLFSARARSNGPAFLAGWVIAMTVVLVIVLAVSSSAGAASGNPSRLASVVLTGLGVLLVLLAVRTWRSRPAPGVDAPMPRWMTAIDSLAPSRAFLIGAVYTGVSPKSLALIIAAGLAISQANLSTGKQAVAVIEFVVIGSITILIPVLYSLLGGQRAKVTLETWKAWLVANNAAVVAVILVLLGAVLIGDGIGPLIGQAN